jgi:hypothetical protein
MCEFCTPSPAVIVDRNLTTIEDLPLRFGSGGDYARTRRTAVANIRSQVGVLNSRLRDSQRETATAGTLATDHLFLGKVAQQVARFTGLEIDFGGIGWSGDRQFSVTGDGVNATLNVYDPALVVGNKRAGLRARSLSLTSDGVTAETVLLLAGLFGVTPTRGNTPRHLHSELFEDEPQIPAGLRDLLAGAGGVIGIDLGAFAQR